jgi:poly(A) polymerase
MDRIDADWLRSDATQRVFALLSDHACHAVGGCVRNTLLGQPVHDIDFATSARPELVLDLAERAGLRAVPTGVEHGTVTLVIGDQPFEVTTFRHDVETDGRRAVVAFANGIEEDARRRDFTMNAVYCDREGSLRDPVGGLADIAARRVRFIEDAERRIREDYLRSLRFFRFNAWYGDPSEGFDRAALDAISRNLDGLETLSRERVGSEIIRLLAAPDPAPAVAVMRATGVLRTVLSGADDTALAPLVALERDFGATPDGIRRLAVLGGEVETLRLSRNQLARIETLREHAGCSVAAFSYRHGAAMGLDLALMNAATLERPLPSGIVEEIESAAAAEFPVRAADLMPALEGKALGEALRRMEERWIESGFALSREALLSEG